MEIGSRIGGKYAVVADLGAGGMGKAVLARSPRGSLVVVKMTLSGSRDDDQRLLDEARAGMRLMHPHIVETLDLVDERGHPALVTAFVSGASMFDLRRAGGPLPPAVVCRIGRQIAEALDALHSAVDENGSPLQMLHRDVTPSNVMVGHDGRSRLIDLGIVQSPESRAERTDTGSVRGTIRYLAPELFANGRHAIATDIWALGVVLWEALLGREAVEGTAAAAVARICTGHLMQLNPDERVDGRVQRAIARLLKTDPKDRPTRARDVAALFSMLEKDLAAGTDTEAEMARLVTGRVGPPEIDDAAHARQIASRAKAVFGADNKLQTTGVAEAAALILEEISEQQPVSLSPDQQVALPRFNTPPQTPAEALQYYVAMLASLERSQR